MSWEVAKGNWNQFKGKVKQQWSKLTDDDLMYIDGKKDELLGRIQERYGYERDRAEREVSDFMKQQ